MGQLNAYYCKVKEAADSQNGNPRFLLTNKQRQWLVVSVALAERQGTKGEQEKRTGAPAVEKHPLIRRRSSERAMFSGGGREGVGTDCKQGPADNDEAVVAVSASNW